MQVSTPATTGYTDKFVNVGYAPFCLPEVIVTLVGSLVVAGLPLDAIPGEDLKAKRKNLGQATIDQLKQYLTNGGWMVRLKDVGVLVVPTGFLLLKAAETATTCLRWSFCGDERDLYRTGVALEALLAAYPEMKNPHLGYQQFMEWIQSD